MHHSFQHKFSESFPNEFCNNRFCFRITLLHENLKCIMLQNFALLKIGNPLLLFCLLYLYTDSSVLEQESQFLPLCSALMVMRYTVIPTRAAFVKYITLTGNILTVVYNFHCVIFWYNGEAIHLHRNIMHRSRDI